ncbi:MAG: OmpA family protein [Bacteroidia bacterium]|nr:OmpA family protein [Bacteroidia bacterium]MDW8089706.1 OmpA family protein [Bacteroidia bacterium]
MRRFSLASLWLTTMLLAQRSLRQIESLYYRGEFSTLIRDEVDTSRLGPHQALYYASAYYQLGQRDKAYELYRWAFAHLSPTTVEPAFLVEYGRLCLYNKDPDAATAYLQEALQRTTYPDSVDFIQLYLAYARQFKIAQNEPQPTNYRWIVQNLEALNTPHHEYSLFFHKGDAYFIRRSDPSRGIDPEDLLPYEGLYRKRPDEPEPKPVNFFPKKHEGIAGFIGDTLIVYRSARRRGDFYIAYPQGEREWASPIFWKAFPNSYKGSEDALCEDPKSNSIIFSSDRRGTLGRKDLWIVRRLPNGNFSLPENLTVLNTPYDEDAPFLVGDTLYFAHNGLNSMGGYDLFFSVRQPDGTWGPPKRLPFPINTPAHESYLFFTHPDTLYLSSDRPGGKGGMDLYRLIREPIILPASSPPPKVYTLSIRFYDAQTGQPVAASFLLNTAAEDKPVLSTLSDSTSLVKLPKPSAGQYLIYAQAKGYAVSVQPITIEDTGDIQASVPLLPLSALERLVLTRIHFNFDQYELRKEAPAALDSIVQILHQYPTLVLEVAGHTDSIGSYGYNQRLSERRANRAYLYLVQKGIPAYRLKPRGYGEEQPLVPNDTPYHRFLNRRVEFRPLTKAGDS